MDNGVVLTAVRNYLLEHCQGAENWWIQNELLASKILPAVRAASAAGIVVSIDDLLRKLDGKGTAIRLGKCEIAGLEKTRMCKSSTPKVYWGMLKENIYGGKAPNVGASESVKLQQLIDRHMRSEHISEFTQMVANRDANPEGPGGPPGPLGLAIA
jgi:hypothetical protein